MKETLIILGNGFDLDLGWKTSYAEFYQAKKARFAEFNGMRYIQDMVQGEHWHDLEGYIRTCLKEMPQSRAEERQHFWWICRNLMFDYFKSGGTKIYNTNKASCAYKFLTVITKESTIVTFNYTNPFKKNSIPTKATEFIHIHGDIENTTQPAELKLGVDEGVISENSIISGEQTLPIVKSHENKYVDRLFQSLKTHKNVALYGHSLGQTDADYFKSYFLHIISGDIFGQNINFVTKDVKGLQQIKNNLKKYGIEYDNVALSKCNVIPVYTEDGINSKEFQELLNLI